jgi:hypothetical protein
LDGGEEDSAVGNYLLFLILNADFTPQRILIPPPKPGMEWYRIIDTSLPAGEDFLSAGRERAIDPVDSYTASPRSTVVLLAR